MDKQLVLGAAVKCVDGMAGWVQRVVADPESKRPQYLTIRRRQLPPREVVVPAALVLAATPRTVHLATTLAALDEYPDFEVTLQTGPYARPIVLGYPRAHSVVVPPDTRRFTVLRQRSVPDESVPVASGMVVRDAQRRRVGRIDGLIVDPASRQASAVILRRARTRGDRRIVPADRVSGVHEGEMQLSLTGQEIAELRRYAPSPEAAA